MKRGYIFSRTNKWAVKSMLNGYNVNKAVRADDNKDSRVTAHNKSHSPMPWSLINQSGRKTWVTAMTGRYASLLRNMAVSVMTNVGATLSFTNKIKANVCGSMFTCVFVTPSRVNC